MARKKMQAATPERKSTLSDPGVNDGATKRLLQMAAIKYALDDGSYRVPPDHLADKLIERLRGSD